MPRGTIIENLLTYYSAVLGKYMFQSFRNQDSHFEFFQSLKTSHTTLRWIFLQSLIKLNERNPVLRIDNHHRFWNWEPWGGVMSAIALQWQF
jgi:hypothetical protein